MNKEMKTLTFGDVTYEVVDEKAREGVNKHEAELLKAFVKVTTEPSPYHHITDSANMKVVDFGMEGITEQYTGTITDDEGNEVTVPNPDYPQDIKLAGEYNEATGRYEHKCCVGNKNLWNAEYARDVSNWDTTLGWYPYISIRVPKGSTVTVSYKQTLSAGLGLYLAVSLDGTEADCTWLYHNSATNLIRNKVSVVAKNDYIYINLASVQYNDTLEKFMQYIGNDLQIEISDTQTDYTTHASQQFTLTSDRPLTMWDKLVKRDGVWGWSIWSKEFEMTSDITWYGTVYADQNSMLVSTPVSDIEQFEVMCDIFRGVNKMQGYLLTNEITYQDGRVRLRVSLDMVSNLNEFKVWIEENPFKIQAKMLTEQAFIPLPDEEQTLLNNLETYYGVTNVYNEQGCPMWLCYTCDSKLYVDKKLEQINNALLSLGANV